MNVYRALYRQNYLKLKTEKKIHGNSTLKKLTEQQISTLKNPHQRQGV